MCNPGCDVYVDDDDFTDVLAYLANCKTPSNTDWSQEYGGENGIAYNRNQRVNINITIV